MRACGSGVLALEAEEWVNFKVMHITRVWTEHPQNGGPQS